MSRFDMINKDDEDRELLFKIGSKGPPKAGGLIAKKPKVEEPVPVPEEDDGRDIFKKIADRDYENKLPWVRVSDKTPEGIAARQAYGAETSRLMEKFKQDLFREYGVENNPRAQEAWDIAWDHGHASGYNDVACHFSDIVALILPKPGDRLDLTEDEEYAAFAALCTMVEDIHAVQDQMTDTQWKAAEALYKRLESRINARRPAAPRRRRKS